MTNHVLLSAVEILWLAFFIVVLTSDNTFVMLAPKQLKGNCSCNMNKINVLFWLSVKCSPHALILYSEIHIYLRIERSGVSKPVSLSETLYSPKSTGSLILIFYCMII